MKRRYEASRLIEATMVIEADSLKDVMQHLPESADDLAQDAGGVAFASNWTITEATPDASEPGRSFEVSDVDIELRRTEGIVYAIIGHTPEEDTP